MRQAILFTALMTAGSCLSAEYSSTPVLVELFTSEGCSSCPPADRLLTMLDQAGESGRAQVIVLSEHVDYWNAIGWKDPFSSPEYSKRQRAYVKQLRLESAYTPQMVVDGTFEFVGSDSKKAQTAIAQAARFPKLNMDVSPEGAVRFHNTSNVRVDVYVVLAKNSAESQVKRGENAGKRLQHAAVATRIVEVGIAGSGETLESKGQFVRADRDGFRLIAFGQDTQTGRIVAAAQAR